MEASEFKNVRDTALQSFQTQYNGLKSTYSSAVINALKEQDRSKQCLLIKQVLDTNKKITALINSFKGTADPETCKANPLLKQRLQSDLEEYNKQYENIQQGSNQLNALKSAIETANEKSNEIQQIFPWYAILIIISVVILIFIIVFRSGSSGATNAQTSTSVFPRTQG
jgi:Fe2+ transport system protein B